MSLISFSPSSLKEGRVYEYLIRFVLGGASATLIEKHEIRRKLRRGWMVGAGAKKQRHSNRRRPCSVPLACCLRGYLFANGARQRSDRVHRGIARLGGRLDRRLVHPPKDAESARSRASSTALSLGAAGLEEDAIGTGTRTIAI
jgi:hypothetical protein